MSSAFRDRHKYLFATRCISYISYAQLLTTSAVAAREGPKLTPKICCKNFFSYLDSVQSTGPQITLLDIDSLFFQSRLQWPEIMIMSHTMYSSWIAHFFQHNFLFKANTLLRTRHKIMPYLSRMFFPNSLLITMLITSIKLRKMFMRIGISFAFIRAESSQPFQQNDEKTFMWISIHWTQLATQHEKNESRPRKRLEKWRNRTKWRMQGCTTSCM